MVGSRIEQHAGEEEIRKFRVGMNQGRNSGGNRVLERRT